MICPHTNENLSDQSKSTALPCFFIRKVLKNDEFCFYVIYTNETLVLLDFFEKIFIFLKKVFYCLLFRLLFRSFRAVLRKIIAGYI